MTLEAPHRHHRKGRLYRVRIDLTVPGGHLVVARDPSLHLAHGDVLVAIRDSFHAARRERLEANHGFLESDGREIYFHRNLRPAPSTWVARSG